MTKNNYFSVKGLVISAMVAALYITLTFAFKAISFGAVQFRISEVLTILPLFTPYAVPGLIVGCFLGNLIGNALIYDVIFGTLATAIAALLTYALRKNKYVALAPPVVVNAIIVGLVLTYGYNLPMLWLNIGSVFAGQAVVCYGVGLPVMYLLERVNFKKWLEN